MENIDNEKVLKVLKAMGYSEDEIPEIAREEVENLMELGKMLQEAMTVNLDEECPRLPDNED